MVEVSYEILNHVKLNIEISVSDCIMWLAR